MSGITVWDQQLGAYVRLRMADSRCQSCGTPTNDLRSGTCFDCASKAERRAAGRSVEEHLRNGLAKLEEGDAVIARVYFSWALERLTGTGDYAPGGTFDAEYPGWRNDTPETAKSQAKSSPSQQEGNQG
jgi:hypothetical protein